MIPRSCRDSSIGELSSPTSLAMGTPLSVTTTSSPFRACASQWLNRARNSVTATSTPIVYN